MIALTPNPSWLRGVAYDSVGRRHRLDGRPVPSVTQVLDRAHPDRFAHVPPAVLARKAAIGTAVHQAAHYHAEGDLQESSVAVDARTRFEAWKWFTETRRVEPILCETVVCSRDLALVPYRRRPYIGRLDFLCVVDRRHLVLLDIKTGLPSLAAPQTLGYLDALFQQYPQLIALDVQRWAVVLDADGTYRVHTFRDDAADVMAFRNALDHAYATDWSHTMVDTQRPTELPLELPDDDPLPGAFDLPDDDDGGLPGPAFEMPEEPGPPVPATSAAMVTYVPEIRELMITPDVEAYLTMLEQAVAPFEATAKAFAEAMERAPVATPEQLKFLGQQSLLAKDREKQIDALFEPAIKKPRQYLDRVYAVKRRVAEWWKVGGTTAAHRYTARTRELEEADRKARVEADRLAREQQADADRKAAAERRRLAEEATKAAQAGNAAVAADLIEQARAVEPATIPSLPEPVSQAAAAAVAGMGKRTAWQGEIVDLKVALLACARPDILREVADAIADGQFTAGGQSFATEMIAKNIRALVHDLPFIPSTVFEANDAELQKRAAADKDTLLWPGFAFAEKTIPVRRPGRAPRVTV